MSLWKLTSISKSQVNSSLSVLRIMCGVMRLVVGCLLPHCTVHIFLLDHLFSVHESVAGLNRSFFHLDVIQKISVQTVIRRSTFILGVILIVKTDRDVPIMNDNARKDGFFLYLTRFDHRKIVGKFF
jgi:hypothetical protein